MLINLKHHDISIGVTRALAAGKLAGLDRKLCKNLEEDVEADSSPLEMSKSPVGPLAESSR